MVVADIVRTPTPLRFGTPTYALYDDDRSSNDDTMKCCKCHRSAHAISRESPRQIMTEVALLRAVASLVEDCAGIILPLP